VYGGATAARVAASAHGACAIPFAAVALLDWFVVHGTGLADVLLYSQP